MCRCLRIRHTEAYVNFAVTLRLLRGGALATLPDLVVNGVQLATKDTPVAYYGYSQVPIDCCT